MRTSRSRRGGRGKGNKGKAAAEAANATGLKENAVTGNHTMMVAPHLAMGMGHSVAGHGMGGAQMCHGSASAKWQMAPMANQQQQLTIKPAKSTAALQSGDRRQQNLGSALLTKRRLKLITKRRSRRTDHDNFVAPKIPHMSTDSPGRDQRQLATGPQEVNAVIPKPRPNISRQMGHGMWMGTGERSQHLLQLFRSRNGLHDAEGIDREGRQTHLKPRIPGTSQLDLLQTLPLLTHQRGTEQDLVLPRLESILESLIIVRAETAGPDMDDVEDNAPGSLAEHLLRQCSLLCTGPGPGTKVG